ncbi:hypothetical protein B9Z55_001505 [Caenorhabditis nigoni]|nr:hypothetical protein B9Z55_001505 [Caenorhabditis nigoni]
MFKHLTIRVNDMFVSDYRRLTEWDGKNTNRPSARHESPKYIGIQNVVKREEEGDFSTTKTMSLPAPRRSNADGLSENMLKAILEPKTSSNLNVSKMEENGGPDENRNSDQKLGTTPHPYSTTATIPRGSGGSFLDSTSISTCSKRSLHSSRQTLSDPKEFYKTAGSRWIRAVRHGNATTVKKMLEEKPELSNYAPNYGPMAIHMATVRSDRSIILLLMAKGADVDARDAAGYTSLQLAIRLGNQSLAHFLISHGANIELIDPEGRQINDYDEWSETDQLAAEKLVYGKPLLRNKAHSFLGLSPSSVSVKSSGSLRPPRPSSTPDNSMLCESEIQELQRNKKRSSWKSFFEKTPIVKKFGSNSKS